MTRFSGGMGTSFCSKQQSLQENKMSEDSSTSTEQDVVDKNGEDNSVSNDLTLGILQLLKPAVDEVDDRVLNIRKSQVDLREHIDQLTHDLQTLASMQKPPINLETYVKKLLNCRRRVVLVNSVLNNAHERLNKLQQNILKETAKKKAMLDSPVN